MLFRSVARREQALRNVAKVAMDIGAPEVLVVPADISDPEAAKRVIEETISHFGQCKLKKEKKNCVKIKELTIRILTLLSASVAFIV